MKNQESIKQNLLQIKKEGNKLTKAVIEIILKQEDIENFIREVQEYGCQNGIAGLIYYQDTIKFYNKYSTEINELVAETEEPPQKLINRWYKQDPLALSCKNQNLLAWFGFEQTVIKIAANLNL
ncbi:MAG: hypothetical protein DDT41_01717 [candidate division WS2 bacterium]|nr:hypothetical protein [Candidatus Psychracetigena formicireducens]